MRSQFAWNKKHRYICDASNVYNNEWKGRAEMSKENAILFFEKIRADKHAAEILKNKEMSEDIKDKAKLFSEAAAELGEDIPAEDFTKAIEEI